MKTVINKTNTQVGSSAQPRQFAIAANEQSFATLSSGLYNDKIRAIIRELSCNAWDAHVMANKSDKPFEIHLPTDLEPFFRITDFGTGLKYQDHGCKPCKGTGKVAIVADGKVVTGECPDCYGSGNLDEVLSLYCTYFASNKRDSNDVVGALGLGSKSPFCYTQAQDDSQGFTVTNRYQGVKRIYSAYVENGAPTCVCLSEEKTKEPNGLEIQFACNLEDVAEFENKGKLALEFFDPMPNVNLEGFEATAQEYEIRTSRWALRKNSFGGLRAIQGMVQYHVGNIDVSRMTPGQQDVARLPLDLFFNIGDLKPTASRESLSLDNHTQASILALLGEVADGMILEVRKQLEACKTAWQARIMLNNLMRSGMAGLIRESLQAGKFYGKYVNFVLGATEPKLNDFDYDVMQITAYHQTNSKKAYQTNVLKKFDEAQRVAIFKEFEKEPKLRDAHSRSIDYADTVVFILNDIGKGASKFVNAYVQDRTGRTGTAYMATAIGGLKHQSKMLKEFKRALDVLGNPEYVLASHLKASYAHLIVKPVSKPRIPGVLVLTETGYSRGGRDSGWQSNTWSKMPEDQLPAGMKFYIPVGERSVGITPKKLDFYTAREAVRFINNARNSELFGPLTKANIYGLSEKAMKKIEGSEDWVNVFDYILDNAQRVLTDELILELSLFVSPFEAPHQEILRKIQKDRKDFSKDSPILKFADAYMPLKKTRTVETGAITELINSLKNAGLYKQPEVANFESMWDKMVTNYYPLLAFISPYRQGNTTGLTYSKLVLEYISRMEFESGFSKEAV